MHGRRAWHPPSIELGAQANRCAVHVHQLRRSSCCTRLRVLLATLGQRTVTRVGPSPRPQGCRGEADWSHRSACHPRAQCNPPRAWAAQRFDPTDGVRVRVGSLGQMIFHSRAMDSRFAMPGLQSCPGAGVPLRPSNGAALRRRANVPAATASGKPAAFVGPFAPLRSARASRRPMWRHAPECQSQQAQARQHRQHRVQRGAGTCNGASPAVIGLRHGLWLRYRDRCGHVAPRTPQCCPPCRHPGRRWLRWRSRCTSPRSHCLPSSIRCGCGRLVSRQ